jgi:hypothetical protein
VVEKAWRDDRGYDKGGDSVKKYYAVFEGGEVELENRDFLLSDVVKLISDAGFPDVAISYSFRIEVRSGKA